MTCRSAGEDEAERARWRQSYFPFGLIESQMWLPSDVHFHVSIVGGLPLKGRNKNIYYYYYYFSFHTLNALNGLTDWLNGLNRLSSDWWGKNSLNGFFCYLLKFYWERKMFIWSAATQRPSQSTFTTCWERDVISVMMMVSQSGRQVTCHVLSNFRVWSQSVDFLVSQFSGCEM